MRSAAWAVRRNRWFAEEQARTGVLVMCAGLCGRTTLDGPLQLHHHDYSRMGFGEHGDLAALCRDCHALLHDVWDSSPQWRKVVRRIASRMLIASIAANNANQRKPSTG